MDESFGCGYKSKVYVEWGPCDCCFELNQIRKLQRPKDGSHECLGLNVAVCPKEDGTLETARYSVNDEAVYEALRCLKNGNHLYCDVDLAVMRTELEKTVKLPREEKKIEVYDSHALINFDTEVPSHGIGRVLPRHTKAVWTVDDCFQEEKSYPHLFPLGEGGEFAQRMYAFGRAEYYKLRLLNDDNRWQKDVSYVFRALNLVQLEYMERSINYALREKGKHVDNSLTPAQILDKIYPRVGKRLRGSEAYFRELRMHLSNMIKANGAAQLFVSINLRYCPELLCHVKPELYGTTNNPKWDGIDGISEGDFVAVLNENCGLAAKMFQKRAESFRTFLMNKTSGAFPDGIYATDVFIKVEFQRSGNPHLHCLVWLSKRFDVHSEDGKTEILKFLDDFLTTEYPDVKTDPELHELVKRYQIHHHTFTCHKGNRNRAKFVRLLSKSLVRGNEELNLKEMEKKENEEEIREVDACDESFKEQCDKVEANEMTKAFKLEFERWLCRFGYPHRISEWSRFLTSKELAKSVRGDRDYTLKRVGESSGRIVAYNAKWLKFFHCNCDCQFVTDVWASVAYLFNYVSKPESKDRDILRDTIKKCDDDGNIRKMLRKCGNAVLSHRQVGKVEAAMILLGCRLYYCSTSSVFVSLCPPSERTRLIKNGSFREGKVISEEDFIMSMIDHYKNRSACVGLSEECRVVLADMTLYEFVSWFVVESNEAKVLGENVDENDVGSVNSDSDLDEEDKKKETNFDMTFKVNEEWMTSCRVAPFTKGRSSRKNRVSVLVTMVLSFACGQSQRMSLSG